MPFLAFADGDTIKADVLNLLMAQVIPRFYSTEEKDAAITAPTTGRMCYLVGTGLQLHAGGVWRTVIPQTAPTLGPYTSHSRYIAPNASQIFTAAAWNRVLLSNIYTGVGAWSLSTVSGGTVFTCQIAGRYGVSGFLRYSSSAVQTARGINLAAGGAYNSNVFAHAGNNSGGTDYWGTTIYGERSFNVGDDMSMWQWTGTASQTPDAATLPYLNVRSIV